MQSQARHTLRRLGRRSLAGAIVTAASLGLLHLTGSPLPATILFLLFAGTAYSACVGPLLVSYFESALVGGTLGIPIWAVSLTVIVGRHTTLDAPVMRSNFASLIAWVLLGVIFGVLHQFSVRVVSHFFGPEEAAPEVSGQQKQVVIVGGGFAGMYTAERLEVLLKDDPLTAITLISETNSLLFTPMLAEVAGGSLEPSHISTPLRGNLRRTAIVRDRVTSVDPSTRKITVGSADGPDANIRGISYDYLVIAVGAITNFPGMEGMESVALTFRSLVDASGIRDRVIEQFELADKEPEPALRRQMLRFVVAGGGYAGVELAGALNDLSRGILSNYANVKPSDIEVILVHSRDRILPELTESLASYALRRMQERGVIFRLNTHVKGATASTVILEDGTLEGQTLIWTAGSAPNPLIASLPFPKDKRGSLVVDTSLAVQGYERIWALGDCAAVNDALTGKPCPPTAQFAIREAEIVARNIQASIQGKSPLTFHFKSLGSLCVVGHQTACAELSIPFTESGSIKFSGLAAWLLWRGIYLAKLPSFERRLRVLLDWTMELFFPRDIVQTVDRG